MRIRSYMLMEWLLMTFVQRHISDRVGSLHIAPAKFPAPLLRPYLPQLPPATCRNIILYTVYQVCSPNPSLSIHSFYSDTRLHPDPSRISIHILCPQIIIFYSWGNEGFGRISWALVSIRLTITGLERAPTCPPTQVIAQKF